MGCCVGLFDVGSETDWTLEMFMGIVQKIGTAKRILRTGIGNLIPGDKVNLKRALRVGDSMADHIFAGMSNR